MELSLCQKWNLASGRMCQKSKLASKELNWQHFDWNMVIIFFCKLAILDQWNTFFFFFFFFWMQYYHFSVYHKKCFKKWRDKAPIREWYLVNDRPTSTSLTFSEWSIIIKQSYTWTHIVNGNVCVGLIYDDTPAWKCKAGRYSFAHGVPVAHWRFFPYVANFVNEIRILFLLYINLKEEVQ